MQGTSTLIPKLSSMVAMLVLLERRKRMNQPLEPTENYISRIIESGDAEFNHLNDDALWDEFFEMVEEKVKPGNDIVATLTPEKAEMWHMATGVCTEAGELLDAVKKHCIYNKKADLENIVEELGDLMFYFVGLVENLQCYHNPGISFRRILEQNIIKLRKRYKKGYSDQEAQQRADKTQEALKTFGITGYPVEETTDDN